MTFYKFKEKEVLHNRVKTYPSIKFNIYNGNVYYNNHNNISGEFASSINNIPPGNLSLYELNVDRLSGSNNLIYPFVTKDGSFTSFKSITTSSFNSDFVYGATVSGSYPLSASITSKFFYENRASGSNRQIGALKNTLRNYLVLSPQFAYSSSISNNNWDKRIQTMRMLDVPSIFYGSSIKKGSVSLKYYMTGTLMAELRDDKQNGELRQAVSSSNADSGSVAGVVLYNQGIVLLTGSWDLDGLETDFPDPSTDGSTTLRKPRWYDFGITEVSGGAVSDITGSSFVINMSGTNYVPTVTMFATAPKGEANYSNNPTSLEYDSDINVLANYSGSQTYIENNDVKIKNISSASYSDPAPTFEKTVYINSVGIYDENKNLIAVAKMAKPIRKRDSDDLTFKLKLDF
jgi:hypothetical protein